MNKHYKEKAIKPSPRLVFERALLLESQLSIYYNVAVYSPYTFL